MVVVTEFSHFKSYNYKFLESGFMQSEADRLVVVIMGRVVSGQKMSSSNHKRKSTLQFKAIVQLTINTP